MLINLNVSVFLFQAIKTVKKGPTTLDMVLEAIAANDDRKGVSVASIKSYLLDKYQVMVNYNPLISYGSEEIIKTTVLISFGYISFLSFNTSRH